MRNARYISFSVAIDLSGEARYRTESNICGVSAQASQHHIRIRDRALVRSADRKTSDERRERLKAAHICPFEALVRACKSRELSAWNVIKCLIRVEIQAMLRAILSISVARFSSRSTRFIYPTIDY